MWMAGRMHRFQKAHAVDERRIAPVLVKAGLVRGETASVVGGRVREA